MLTRSLMTLACCLAVTGCSQEASSGCGTRAGTDTAAANIPAGSDGLYHLP